MRDYVSPSLKLSVTQSEWPNTSELSDTRAFRSILTHKRVVIAYRFRHTGQNVATYGSEVMLYSKTYRRYSDGAEEPRDQGLTKRVTHPVHDTINIKYIIRACTRGGGNTDAHVIVFVFNAVVNTVEIHWPSKYITNPRVVLLSVRLSVRVGGILSHFEKQNYCYRPYTFFYGGHALLPLPHPLSLFYSSSLSVRFNYIFQRAFFSTT